MDNIKVSVIVPVYNGEEYIQTSISSIINQEFSENYEIIVVDDGSDDNSLDIAQELLSKSDIPYKLVHQRNSGVSVARNNYPMVGCTIINSSSVFSSINANNNWFTF